MFSKSTLLITLTVVGVLAGCATADTYRNTPSSKLCIDYLTLPSMNINHGARAEELSRRGENCSGYMGMAELRRDANRDANQPQQIRTPVQTQCYRNGAYVNCTSF